MGRKYRHGWALSVWNAQPEAEGIVGIHKDLGERRAGGTGCPKWKEKGFVEIYENCGRFSFLPMWKIGRLCFTISSARQPGRPRQKQNASGLAQGLGRYSE